MLLPAAVAGRFWLIVCSEIVSLPVIVSGISTVIVSSHLSLNAEPVKTFDTHGDIQGFVTTMFSHCSAARSACETEVDSALIYTLFSSYLL